MASRRGKKPRRKAVRRSAATKAKSHEQDPRLEKLIGAFSRLNAALESRPQPTAVQDALDEFRELFAAYISGSGVGGGGEQQLAPEDLADGDSESGDDNDQVKQKSMLDALRDNKKNKGYELDRRYRTVENATLEELVKQQALDKRGKEESSQRVRQFERRDISQVPSGFLTADEPEGLFMVAAPKPWILNVDSYARCVHLLTKIGDMVSMDLGFRVSLLALTHLPEQHSTGDGKQVDEWLSYTYASLAALEGKAHRQDRRIIELTDMQLALVGQLKGLALRREHARVAKSKGIPTADAMELIERDLAELYAKLPPMMAQKAKALEPQATPERVVEHLRKFYGEEVPHRLTASAVEHMASRVSLNQGSKGKQSAERVVLDWFEERGYK